jgi:hypothetical protein
VDDDQARFQTLTARRPQKSIALSFVYARGGADTPPQMESECCRSEPQNKSCKIIRCSSGQFCRLRTVTAPGSELHLQTERSYMTTNNCPSQIHIAEFEIEGFCCLRYFHPATGALCVDGPQGSRPARKRYIRKYEGLCLDQSIRDFLASMRPETPMNAKLHALLHLMEEHDEARQGMMITPELFILVLDSFAPWTPVELDARH